MQDDDVKPPPTRPPADDSAVTQTVGGAAPTHGVWSRIRDAVVPVLTLLVTLGLGVIAAIAGLVLTTFGLGGAVLAVAALIVLVGATVWRRAVLPATIVALSLALPSAQAALSTTRIDRSHGTLNVDLRNPRSISGDTYRRGTGPILIDLRRFRAPSGSRQVIDARADTGRLVVALPTDRCFNLEVRYRVDRMNATTDFVLMALEQSGLQSGDGWYGSSYSATGLSRRAQQTDDLQIADWARQHPTESYPSQYDLLAYSRNPMQPGRWIRRAPDPTAPTIRLNLRASQQIVIGSYPAFVGPLNLDGGNAYDQTGGMRWPDGIKPPDSPGERAWAHRSSIRTSANRAAWVSWERDMVAWATAQARRYAGPCATKAELRDRAVTFMTQPERMIRPDGSLQVLRGGPTTRHSSIEQKPVTTDRSLLEVEVNGLGETKVIRVEALADGTAPEEYTP